MAQAANADVLSDAPVEVLETSKAQAEALGALAFFKDKYGDRVRVVRAGVHSTELCGGTHVDALGMIGPITIVSEGSIGSNTRRIEAVTGPGSLALLAESRRTVDDVARLLRVEPGGVLEALQKVLDRQREADKEIQRMQGARLQEDAARLAQLAEGGVVVHRQDGFPPDQLRELAQAVARRTGLAWWWWPAPPTGPRWRWPWRRGTAPSTPVPPPRNWPRWSAVAAGDRPSWRWRAVRTPPRSMTCWPRHAAGSAPDPVRAAGVR